MGVKKFGLEQSELYNYDSKLTFQVWLCNGKYSQLSYIVNFRGNNKQT